ncbi:hypothetical protein [Halocatena halophila]|uniref:hypothetical protein n=1 Tax=Halocatena halophila TaxID=2814576 RepID=UPI002ED6978C
MKAESKDRIAAFIAFIITFPIFEYVVQPILILVHPMFKDQNMPADQVSGYLPQTPAGWAFITTMISIIIISVFFIEPYIKYIFETGD